MTRKTAPSLRDIRHSFLDFFAGRDHTVVSSSSLVPHDDPTLLFTNAGMVQFKNVFTGIEKRPYVRAATSQKCVRAGGKHNDLDNVGYTARHLTFFEMLGNFSFGDYFKEEAIASAWELVTGVFGLPKDRLVVTVYHEDDEAHSLWKKIAGLGDDRIIRIATSDNFWSMGDTGPCGPCSEIFFDHGPGVAGGPPGSPEEDGDRFVEIWNLVFMQFDAQADGTRKPLPKPSIDTGMGLERMSTVLQGVHNVYDVDLFRTLIEAAADVIKAPVGGPDAASYRVIADHVRSTSFLIADGVLPSNDGRGYVLRRILRRAMRHAHILGAEDPVLHKIAPALIAEMNEAFPELRRAEPLILETLHNEEVRFREMLERGLRLLEEETGSLGKGACLSGDVAFKLYDTYGFPLDLTQDALRPRGIEVDLKGFDEAMERQRSAARAAWAGSGETATDEVWFKIRERAGGTLFDGYEAEESEARIIALVSDGKEVTEAGAGANVLVVTDRTPFYGESGGQVGDEGTLRAASGAEAVISDAKKFVGDVIVHFATIERGDLKVGDSVGLRIDGARRGRVRANHSATHLLHEALRRVLGPHVAQKGSLVAPDRLRFDFAHNKAMSRAEIAAVEGIVNEMIRQNAHVGMQVMAPDDAVKAGALALFGEKYGEEVRVLTMGLDVNSERVGSYDTGAFSVELCGGTHVRRLGDIQLLKIVSEGAVGSGVRRIEALTGEAARRHLTTQEDRLLEVAEALKARPEDAAARVKQLTEEKRKLERDLTEAKKALALGGGAGGERKSRVRTVGAYQLIADVLEGIPAKELRGLVDAGKKEIGSGVVALIASEDGKAAIAIGVTDDLKDKVSAVDLVRAAVPALGGKGGGGRPDLAQAGGPNADGAGEAVAAIEKALSAL